MIGTFEQIVGPKPHSGNCQVNCFLTDRTALTDNAYLLAFRKGEI